MVKGIYDELAKPAPKNHFTIGIDDDVTHTSLTYDPAFSTEDPKTVRALFYGLGSDGTVGANKNSIKIIGEQTPNFAQGYFVYDSKKSGSMTTSHLRFGPTPIRSSYLITRASFVACHNFSFLEKMDVLEAAMPGAVFLLNTPYSAAEVWEKLPRSTQQEMLTKKIEFYVIDGYKVAREAGMGTRINTIMQTCFFAISGVLPRDEAIEQIKKAIYKTYGKRGEAVVAKNYAAVDAALAHLEKVTLPAAATSGFDLIPSISDKAPQFVRDVLGQIAAGHGDLLPVSAIPAGGAFPTGTAQWEKRNIAQFIPVWDKEICIQCGKCVMVCPHAVIRSKVYSPELGDKAPATFKWAKPKWKESEQDRYTLQVARGLHRLRDLRGSLPGEEQERRQQEGHQYGAPGAAARCRARQLGVLPDAARGGPLQALALPGEGSATLAAALRVLRSLRGLRRNSLYQAAHPTLRRSALYRQRHRLLIDLRRQPAYYALRIQRPGPRTDLGQLALRG
jgi:pyruvate-ferredoxin/flavodoxin oxidoreductase